VIGGKVRAVRLTFGFSGNCGLANPWPSALIGGVRREERVLALAGTPDAVVELADADDAWDGIWPLAATPGQVRHAADGWSRLGMERDY